MNALCGALNMALVLIFLSPVGCAHEKAHEQIDPSQVASLADLQDRRAIYEQDLVAAATGQDGWIGKDCDALLYSSLFAASLADPGQVRIVAAEDAPGHWQRRNTGFGACYPANSDSTISKDMLLGLTYYAWRSKNLDLMKRLTDYGLAHAWVMGDPHSNVGKVVASPDLIGLFYQVIYRLGGPDHPSRKIPTVYPSGLTGFEAHLQVLAILLHGEVDDAPGISDEMLARLKEHAAAQPQNPFYATALAIYTGDSDPAIALLGDLTQWPRSGLPTQAQHCSAWVVQRDAGADWQPCTDANQNTLWGADFVWTVDLLTRPRRGS